MTMMKVMNLHCLISHHVDDDVGVVHRALLISPVGPFPTTEDPPRDKVDLGRYCDDRQQKSMDKSQSENEGERIVKTVYLNDNDFHPPFLQWFRTISLPPTGVLTFMLFSKM